MSIFLSFAILGFVVFCIAAITRPASKADVHKAVPPTTPSIEKTFGSVQVNAGDVRIAVDYPAKPAGTEQQPPHGVPPAAVREPRNALSQIIDIVVADNRHRWAATLAFQTLLLSSVCIWLFRYSFIGPNSPETPFVFFYGSHYIGSAFFGFMFGTITGYWLISVYYRDPEQPVGYKEIVSCVVMVVVFLLGVIGQDAFTKLIERLSAVEIAGAKLSLSEAATSKAGSSSSSLASTIASSKAPPSESYGLQAVVDLPAAMARDYAYARLVAATNGYGDTVLHFVDERPSISSLMEAAKHAETALNLYSSCLQDYVESTGDDARVGRLLERVAAHMRNFASATLPSDSEQPRRRDNTSSDYEQRNRWEQTFAESVSDLLNESEMAAALDGMVPIVDVRGCGPLKARTKDEQIAALDWLSGPDWRQRPYFWLAYASMLAYNHQNVAAIEALDDWVNALKLANEKKFSNLANVSGDQQVRDRILWINYIIRVRNTIAIYMDEWIRGTYAVKSEAVVKYQLDNLHRLIEDMEGEMFGNSVTALITRLTVQPKAPIGDYQFVSAEYLPERNGCPLSPKNGDGLEGVLHHYSDEELELYEINTLVSAKLNYIWVALDSKDYYDDGGTLRLSVDSYLRELLDLNLSCLGLFPPNKQNAGKFRRAQSLQAYARVTYANLAGTDKLRALVSSDKLRHEFETALNAAKLGRRLIEAEKPTDHGRFVDRISVSPAAVTLSDLEHIETVLSSELEALGH